MKIKTTDLIGDPLDWAILTLHGWKDLRPNPHRFDQRLIMSDDRGDCQFLEDMAVSTSGDFVIDIMGRERITVRPISHAERTESGSDIYRQEGWAAYVEPKAFWITPRPVAGPTLGIAVCRCFVASKLGDWVEVPDELVKEK